ncbi:MAG: hypothetical protein E6J34_18425 [Chloroflexi bacterium]|nr:MAG: hypothetical protein E6J34_18425 [Chloroflexota bacterium]
MAAARLHNMYGPTETTIWSTTAAIEPGAAEVSLGSPIVNTQIYLLDAHLQPVPIGVAGEIYIGGEGLARGYLKRPEQTAERFLPNLWGEHGGGRLYRTGDIARYDSAGRLRILGRRDQQVKLRGYRIELAEIEASLRTYPAIREAVVVLREEGKIGKHLVAYVVVQGQEEPTHDQLYTHLRRQLPEYMLPNNIVFLDTLPLTPNGKIDRKALPAPNWQQLRDSTEIVVPQTPLQAQLAMIWSELLHLPQVSIQSNFFALGGHSLLVAQLMVQLEAAFGVKVPLRSLFEAATIVQLADVIERIQMEILEQADREDVERMLIELEGFSD